MLVEEKPALVQRDRNKAVSGRRKRKPIMGLHDDRILETTDPGYLSASAQ
jgi:hypothetical protein